VGVASLQAHRGFIVNWAEPLYRQAHLCRIKATIMDASQLGHAALHPYLLSIFLSVLNYIAARRFI
jgi:hypothetical protein